MQRRFKVRKRKSVYEHKTVRTRVQRDTTEDQWVPLTEVVRSKDMGRVRSKGPRFK